jgi:hypothetical protein
MELRPFLGVWGPYVSATGRPERELHPLGGCGGRT